MKWLTILRLRLREFVLEAEVQNGEALVRDHRARLMLAYRNLRGVRARLATLESPQRMLDQALKGKALRC